MSGCTRCGPLDTRLGCRAVVGSTVVALRPASSARSMWSTTPDGLRTVLTGRWLVGILASRIAALRAARKGGAVHTLGIRVGPAASVAPARAERGGRVEERAAEPRLRSPRARAVGLLRLELPDHFPKARTSMKRVCRVWPALLDESRLALATRRVSEGIGRCHRARPPHVRLPLGRRRGPAARGPRDHGRADDGSGRGGPGMWRQDL